MSYRIRLLGDIVVTRANGEVVSPTPAGEPMRALVALALKPGQARSETELAHAIWGPLPSEGHPKVSVPISRARDWGVPIPPQLRGSGTYRLALDRGEIDATAFIDRVNAGRITLEPEMDYLLGLWSGRPESVYSFLPDAEFRPLQRARQNLISQLESWPTKDLARLRNLQDFTALYEDECTKIPVATPTQAKRLLLVDDDESLTTMVRQLLVGYDVLVAHDVGSAMATITDDSVRIDGALVDLHLSARGSDSAGLQVLDALTTFRASVPRILMTSSPPADALSRVQTEYALYDVLIKNSAEAPIRTRRIVDDMMSDREDQLLLRIRSNLETLISRTEKAAIRQLVSARQGLRRQTATAVDVEHAAATLEQLTSGNDAARATLEQETDIEKAEQVVAEYSAKYSGLLSYGTAR